MLKFLNILYDCGGNMPLEMSLAEIKIFDEKGSCIQTVPNMGAVGFLPAGFYRVELGDPSREGFFSVPSEEIKALQSRLCRLQFNTEDELSGFLKQQLEDISKKVNISSVRLAMMLIEQLNDKGITGMLVSIFSKSLRDDKERLFGRPLVYYIYNIVMREYGRDALQSFFKLFQKLEIPLDVCHTFYGTFLHEAIANEYSNLGALFEIIPEAAKAKLLVSKDGQGRTPWMLALRTRNISLIKEMIKFYLDKPTHREQLLIPDMQGRTPFMVAMALGIKPAIDFLLKVHPEKCLEGKDQDAKNCLDYYNLSQSAVTKLLDDIFINDMRCVAYKNYFVFNDIPITIFDSSSRESKSTRNFLLQSNAPEHMKRINEAIKLLKQKMEVYKQLEGKSEEENWNILLRYYLEKGEAWVENLLKTIDRLDMVDGMLKVLSKFKEGCDGKRLLRDLIQSDRDALDFDNILINILINMSRGLVKLNIFNMFCSIDKLLSCFFEFNCYSEHVNELPREGYALPVYALPLYVQIGKDLDDRSKSWKQYWGDKYNVEDEVKFIDFSS